MSTKINRFTFVDNPVAFSSFLVEKQFIFLSSELFIHLELPLRWLHLFRVPKSILSAQVLPFDRFVVLAFAFRSILSVFESHALQKKHRSVGKLAHKNAKKWEKYGLEIVSIRPAIQKS